MKSKTLKSREKNQSLVIISSCKLNLLCHTNPMGDTVVNARKSVMYPNACGSLVLFMELTV